MKKQFNWAFPLLLTVLVTICLATGCTKEGFGGTANLVGTVAHHEEPIPNATVYIKFGAEELPGTEPTDFDESVQADHNGMYNFYELQKGDYYVYAIGYDSSISQVVFGGAYASVSAGKANALDIAVVE